MGIEAALGIARSVVWSVRSQFLTEEQSPLSWDVPAVFRGQASIGWPHQYVWKPARNWLQPLRVGLRSHLLLQEEIIPQPFEHVVNILLRHPAGTLRIAVDYADSFRINPNAALEVDLYFKMQFHKDGYKFQNVVPGGYVPAHIEFYRYLQILRRIKDASEVRYEVFGRFGTKIQNESRNRAIEVLQSQNRFLFFGGFARVHYTSFLSEVAHAKVCVDLPGHGDFCFRLFDYMGVGSAIVGPRPNTVLHHPLVDGQDVVYCERDLSDLVERCEALIRDQRKCRELVLKSRQYFDRYIRPEQLAAYYLFAIAKLV